MHPFYHQVHDFCQLMHEEIVRRDFRLPEPPATAAAALGFTEKFLLCPTLEAARDCIHRDLAGALHFAKALDGATRRLEQPGTGIPSGLPPYQTRFYILSATVQEYIQSLQA
jgi:hypothetical protein